MTAIVFKQFKGWIPKIPAQLLPNDAAQAATNCDLSKGIIAGIKGNAYYLGHPLSNAADPIRGLYTENGLDFFTWDEYVYAYKSPVNNEMYNRVYYVENKVFRVSYSPEFAQLGGMPNGGSPPTSWRVGVPAPINPNFDITPTLSLVDRTDLADYPTATLTVNAWWDVNGVAQNRQDNISISVVTPWKEFTFIAPVEPTGTEEDPIYDPQLVVNIVLKDGNAVLFSLNTRTNSTEPAKTLALPGGIEIMVELVSGSTYKITMSWGVIETRAYVYTHINEWLEESAPSLPALVSPTYLQDVRLVCERADFTTDGFRPWQATYIYRTFGSSANYLRVDVTFEQTTQSGAYFDQYLDTTRSATGISTGLVSLDWFPPEGMPGNLNTIFHHVVLANNGWFAGFRSNTLMMSEPYRPHAWPYSVTFSKSIKGVAVAPQALVVTTEDACYLVTGPHPKSVVVNKLPIPVGGISQQTMCQVEGGVVFLSNDGIVFVEGSTASLDASQTLWTRERWRELYANYLDTMVVGYHDGFLIASAAPTNNIGFVVRLDEAAGSLTSYPTSVDGMFRLPSLDTLYVTVGKNIYRFRADSSALPVSWHSKDFIFPKYTPLGALYARTSGTMVVFIYTKNTAGATTLYWTETLPANGYLRIPATSNNLSCSQRVWSFYLTGNGEVHEFAVAQTMAELQRV